MGRGPGKWQRWILEELEEEPDGFVLAWRLDESLGREATPSEHSAAFRAARTLAERGALELCRVWAINAVEVRTPMLWTHARDAEPPKGRVDTATGVAGK